MEALSFAWERVKSDPGTILGTLVLGWLLTASVSFVGGIFAAVYQAGTGVMEHAGRPSADPIVIAIQAVSSLLSWPVEAFFMGGMTLFALKVARGEMYAMGDIFAGGRYFLNVLVATLVVGILVFTGILCLIVPGVIIALGLIFVVPVIVDKELGPIEALKESWRITQGKKGDIFLLVLGFILVTIAGLCACCVGALLAAPVCLIAQTYAYLRLTGQKTA